MVWFGMISTARNSYLSRLHKGYLQIEESKIFSTPSIHPHLRSSIFGCVARLNTRLFVSSGLRPFTIRPYCPVGDREAVRKIAFQHVDRLVSVPMGCKSPEAIDILINERILSAFGDPKICSDVMIVDGKIVGFQNYSIRRLWHGNYGHIMHMAVDQDFQGNGYGSILFQNAMQKCVNNKVHVVTLEITTTKLISYYEKFGYKLIREPDTFYDPETNHIPAGKMGVCLRSSGWLVDNFRLRFSQIVNNVIYILGIVAVVCLVGQTTETLKRVLFKEPSF